MDLVVEEILQIKEIKNIHHVHIWQLNDYDCHFEAHLEFKMDLKLSEVDVICERVERILEEKFKINHCNLQSEYDRDDLKEIIIQD